MKKFGRAFGSVIALAVVTGAGCGSSGSQPGGAGGAGGSGVATGGLPALTVAGNKLQDPSGKTIVLRGASLIDIGSLYVDGGNSAAGITARIDKVIAAGVQGHVVRLPVYPKVDYNRAATRTARRCRTRLEAVRRRPARRVAPMSAADYVANVLKPAVDYASQPEPVRDHRSPPDRQRRQGTSAADATTFWTDVAPQFARSQRASRGRSTSRSTAACRGRPSSRSSRAGSTPSGPTRPTTSSSCRP